MPNISPEQLEQLQALGYAQNSTPMVNYTPASTDVPGAPAVSQAPPAPAPVYGPTPEQLGSVPPEPVNSSQMNYTPAEPAPRTSPVVDPDARAPGGQSDVGSALEQAKQAAPGSLPGDQAGIPSIAAAGAPNVSVAPKPIRQSGGGGGSAGPRPPSAIDQQLGEVAKQEGQEDKKTAQLVNLAQTQADINKAKLDVVAAGKQQAADTAQTNLMFEQRNQQQAQSEADQADQASALRAKDLANRTIDPDHYFTSKTLPARIAVNVGMALGAFGASLGHTANFAGDMVKAGIEQDIDAQKEAINNAKDSAKMQDAIAQRKYGRSMTQNELDAHSRLDGYNYAIAKTDAMAADADSPEAQAKADALKVGLVSERDKAKADLAHQRFGLNTAKEQQAAAQAAARGAAIAAAQKRQDEQTKTYREMVNKNMEQGDDLNIAQAKALAVMGGPGSFQGNLPAYPGKPEAGNAPRAGDPLSFVPKDQRGEAVKEYSEHAKSEATSDRISDLYDKAYDTSGLTSPRQKDAYKAQIAAELKTLAGSRGLNDNVYDKLIEPNMPAMGDPKETQQIKKQNVLDSIKTSTPLLDAHAPGWRAPTTKEAVKAGRQLGFQATPK